MSEVLIEIIIIIIKWWQVLDNFSLA